MKTKFLQRVLWLMIPLLTLFNPIVWASNTTTASDPAPAGTYVAMASGEAVVAGDTIIVVYESGTKAMSTTQNSNNRGQVGVTISNTTPKTITLNGSTTVQALTVAASANSGWTLYTGVGYLYAPSYASGTNNYLRTETSNKDGSGGNWTISYNSMEAAGNGTRRFIKYNTSSSIFSCYQSSSTAAINVYKKAHAVTYKANGGSTTCSDATLYKSNATVTVCSTTPTRSGYTFTGWSANVNLINASTSATITAGTLIAGGTTVKMPAKHLVFTAQWESSGCSNKVNITAGTPETEGSFTLDKTGEQDCCSALTVTVSGITAPTGKRFSAITQSGIATGVTIDQNAKTVTYAANSSGSSTINVTFEAIPKYTVTWHVGESTGTTSNVEYGTLFSALDPESDAPAHGDNALSACGSTKFIGWVKAGGVQTADGGTVSLYNTYKADASDAITSDTHYYAMYAEEEGTAAYTRVTASLGTAWAGDYLIAYSDDVFADGRVGGTGTGGLGEQYVDVDPDDNLDGNNVDLTWGDTYKVTLEEVSSGSNTYLLKTQDGQYNYQSSNSNGLAATSTRATAANYPITVTFTSSSDVKLGLGGSAAGAVFRYNTNGYFRYYKNGGQEAVYLYKRTQSLINYRTGCSVSCAAPTSLTNTSVTKTGATIGWTGGGNGTLDHYEYAYWEDGDTEPTSGFVNNNTNTSATLSGLYSNVKYNWKVRKVCTGNDDSRWSYSNFTTSAASLTYSVPTGASAVTTPATNAGDLNSAEVPTNCGDCWSFAGWTTAAYSESTSAPATLFPAGTKAKVSGDATLHAVYQKSKYQRISSTSDLTAGEDYVLMNIMQGNEYALANSAQEDYPTTDAAWEDIRTLMETDGDDSYVKNPGASIIWRFSGTYSAGQLYNAAADKYLDLSGSASILNTTDDLTFGISASNSLGWDVHSVNYLRQYYITNSDPLRGGWDAYTSLSSGNFSAYIYKRIETKYATSPSCDVYTVTWNVNNGATTSTTSVLSCSGHLESLPSAPADNTLSSCITTGCKFMGWSADKVLPATDTRPSDLFNNLVDAPEITESTTFYAVFAKETTGATGATSKEYSFTSASWGDSEGAWTSGASGNWASSAVQVTTNNTGANATTKSSYDAVTKVTVTYFTNASKGAGTIAIEVGGTAYTGSASVTTTGGTTPRTIDFTPPSTALDGAVKISVTCSTNSIYIKSVKIYYTGATVTYEGYRSACCNDARLTFGTQASPVTEYVITREDLASASTAVEIDCNFQSSNSTSAITWAQTKRIKTDYHSAQTWNSAQPAEGQCIINIANKKISANETGSWQITIAQAMGSTTYCDATATVNILVKTIDKFVDKTNGNFSGEPQSLEDVGNGIVLPTDEVFSTNNGCKSTTRRLVGWIKASDLATYASSRRVDTIDDLKTGDASNKVIAPGTKVQATGVTWYAVWGTEK